MKVQGLRSKHLVFKSQITEALGGLERDHISFKYTNKVKQKSLSVAISQVSLSPKEQNHSFREIQEEGDIRVETWGTFLHRDLTTSKAIGPDYHDYPASLTMATVEFPLNSLFFHLDNPI